MYFCVLSAHEFCPLGAQCQKKYPENAEVLVEKLCIYGEWPFCKNHMCFCLFKLFSFSAYRTNSSVAVQRDTRKSVCAIIVLKSPSRAVSILVVHLSGVQLNVLLHPIKK